MVGQDLRKGRLQAVLKGYIPTSLEIHAVYPHRKHLSAKVRTFVDFLHERFQPIPYWEEWSVDPHD
jgi:DNA-binding transcriptional LysR family regulator